MEVKMNPNASLNDAKMHKKIMQYFIDFLIEFLMTFGGFGRGPDPWFDWQTPQGGSTAAPLFILGLLVDGLRANKVPS